MEFNHRVFCWRNSTKWNISIIKHYIYIYISSYKRIYQSQNLDILYHLSLEKSYRANTSQEYSNFPILKKSSSNPPPSSLRATSSSNWLETGPVQLFRTRNSGRHAFDALTRWKEGRGGGRGVSRCSPENRDAGEFGDRLTAEGKSGGNKADEDQDTGERVQRERERAWDE